MFEDINSYEVKIDNLIFKFDQVRTIVGDIIFVNHFKRNIKNDIEKFLDFSKTIDRNLLLKFDLNISFVIDIIRSFTSIIHNIIDPSVKEINEKNKNSIISKYYKLQMMIPIYAYHENDIKSINELFYNLISIYLSVYTSINCFVDGYLLMNE